MAAPTPPDEATRLGALHALDVLDTDAEDRFDRFTRQACERFGVPIALITLIDRDRQWFKSRQGVGFAESPRDQSFCAHAILGPDVMQVPDVLDDPASPTAPPPSTAHACGSTPARRSRWTMAAASGRCASPTIDHAGSTTATSTRCATSPTKLSWRYSSDEDHRSLTRLVRQGRSRSSPRPWSTIRSSSVVGDGMSTAPRSWQERRSWPRQVLADRFDQSFTVGDSHSQRRMGPKADHTRHSLAKVHAHPAVAVGAERQPVIDERHPYANRRVPAVVLRDVSPSDVSTGVSSLRRPNVARKRSSPSVTPSRPGRAPNGSHIAPKRASKR